MTTGVDAQTCKLIVLDQRIQSHDRVQADHRPRHADQRRTTTNSFTIMDFKGATALFARPQLSMATRFRSTNPNRNESPVPPDDRQTTRWLVDVDWRFTPEPPGPAVGENCHVANVTDVTVTSSRARPVS